MGDGSIGIDEVHANTLNSSLPSPFSLLSCFSSIITAQQVSVALSFIPISPFSSLHVLLLSTFCFHLILLGRMHDFRVIRSAFTDKPICRYLEPISNNVGLPYKREIHVFKSGNPLN